MATFQACRRHFFPHPANIISVSSKHCYNSRNAVSLKLSCNCVSQAPLLSSAATASLSFHISSRTHLLQPACGRLNSQWAARLAAAAASDAAARRSCARIDPPPTYSSRSSNRRAAALQAAIPHLRRRSDARVPCASLGSRALIPAQCRRDPQCAAPVRRSSRCAEPSPKWPTTMPRTAPKAASLRPTGPTSPAGVPWKRWSSWRAFRLISAGSASARRFTARPPCAGYVVRP